MSLTASIAAAGCTTNRNPGSGEPVRDGFVRSAPTSGVNSGSEMPLPPPMISSYTGSETQNRNAYVGPDRAAAIMAQSGSRMRVLGPVNPGADTGVPASNSVAERNASIMNNVASAPTYAGGAVGVIENGIVGTVTADGTIIDNAATANAAPVVLSGNTAAPTSVSSATLTPGAFAGGASATPAATVSNVPAATFTNIGTPVTVASNSTTSRTTTSGTTATTPTTAMNNSTVTASTLAAATTGARVNRRATTAASIATSARSASAITSAATTSGTSVRIVRSGGRVVVTNVQ